MNKNVYCVVPYDYKLNQRGRVKRGEEEREKGGRESKRVHANTLYVVPYT